MLSAESFNKLSVLWLVVIGGEHTEVSLALIEGLGALVETTGKTIMNKGVLNDLLEGGHNVHGGWCLDLDWGSVHTM